MAENKEELYASLRADVEKDIAEENAGSTNTFTADKLREKKRIANRNARRVITGAVVICLAFVGVISLITGGVGLVKRIFDDTKEKERLNRQLAPLVVYDPLPFASVDRADPDMILAASIWSVIANEDTSAFETDEYGQMLLPAASVEKYFSALFGNNYMINHRSFSYDSTDFTYNEDSKTYTIPATSYPIGYTPQVDSIKKSSNERIVTVGYISPASSYDDPSAGMLYKYVDYVYTKQDGEFYLSSIRESDKVVENQSNSRSESNSQ